MTHAIGTGALRTYFNLEAVGRKLAKATWRGLLMAEKTPGLCRSDGEKRPFGALPGGDPAGHSEQSRRRSVLC